MWGHIKAPASICYIKYEVKMLAGEFTMASKAKENKNEFEVDAESIMEVIQEGTTVYSEISVAFIQNFTFYDKTLYQWATDLMIEIPHVKNLDSNEFRKLLLQLARNVQIANNYYSTSCSISDAIQGGNSVKKSDVINALVSNYAKKGAKRPAANIIEKMADSYMSSTLSAKVAAKLVKDFWKQRLDMLLEVRKILEQVGMSLHVEMKWTAQ